MQLAVFVRTQIVIRFTEYAAQKSRTVNLSSRPSLLQVALRRLRRRLQLPPARPLLPVHLLLLYVERMESRQFLSIRLPVNRTPLSLGGSAFRSDLSTQLRRQQLRRPLQQLLRQRRRLLNRRQLRRLRHQLPLQLLSHSLKELYPSRPSRDLTIMAPVAKAAVVPDRTRP